MSEKLSEGESATDRVCIHHVLAHGEAVLLFAGWPSDVRWDREIADPLTGRIGTPTWTFGS